MSGLLGRGNAATELLPNQVSDPWVRNTNDLFLSSPPVSPKSEREGERVCLECTSKHLLEERAASGRPLFRTKEGIE